MIINRTLEYKRLNPINTKKDFVDVSHIRKFIDELYKNIKILSIKQDKLKLPSFESKSKKRLEIQKINDLLKTRFKEVETSISEIRTNNDVLNKFIIDYFNTKLKTVLLEYKQIQQAFLDTRVHEIKPGDSDIYKEDEYKQDFPLMELGEIIDIQKNIYEITNFILEMKMLMHLGSSSIDRLDLNYETANTNVEKINNELKIMKENYKGFKDKFMYFLVVLVVILMILSFIKIEIKRNRRSHYINNLK